MPVRFHPPGHASSHRRGAASRLVGPVRSPPRRSLRPMRLASARALRGSTSPAPGHPGDGGWMPKGFESPPRLRLDSPIPASRRRRECDVSQVARWAASSSIYGLSSQNNSPGSGARRSRTSCASGACRGGRVAEETRIGGLCSGTRRAKDPARPMAVSPCAAGDSVVNCALR